MTPKRLLLVSHRPLGQEGGATARWRAFERYLPGHGWQVDVISAPMRASGVEFSRDQAAARRVAARARVMAQAGRAARPAFAAAGLRPDAMPLSMLWSLRGPRAVAAHVEAMRPDVVLATAPPAVALIAARRGLAAGGPPLVAELRDLWAGSPAFELREGPLGRVERWVFERCARVVVMTPEAAADVRRRHPDVDVAVIGNGFDPVLVERAGTATASPKESGPDSRVTLLHSGTLNAGRPVGPLLAVLAEEPYRSRFRLVLHGFLTPDVRADVARAADRVLVDVVAPSSWEDAVDRIAAADVGLVLQGSSVGDATAVASKVFEYLALQKPVLTVTDGGATEQLLRRLGQDALCARIGDAASVRAALDRILARNVPAVLTPEALAPYDRRAQAGELAALLDHLL